MKSSYFPPLAALLAAYVSAVAASGDFALAEDWPLLGRNGTRNSVSGETGAPTLWRPEIRNREGKLSVASQGVRWTAKLGLQSFSSPVISGGLVWIGVSDVRRHNEMEEYVSVLQCFRAADGKRVYEFVSQPLGNRHQDAGWSGLGSSPLIEGDRLWIMTNRCELLCLDIGPLLRGEGEPRELWKLNCIKQFDINPRVALMGPPRPCSIGPSWKGRIYVTLNNGISDDRISIPKPDSPSLVCLNKDTGEVYWQDNSPGKNILLSQFASPTISDIAGQMQVIVPQSDGWLRGFDPETGEKLWEFDVNPKESSLNLSSQGERNDLFANAVVYEDRVYIASGRDAEQGEGLGRLVCIDPAKRGDISSELAVDAKNKPLPRRRLQAVDTKAGENAIPNPNSGLVWECIKTGDDDFLDRMHRSVCSVTAAKGLVIAADSSGLVHCFDAKTGKRHWKYDMLAFVFGSPLIVDDKVFVADEDGEVAIFQLGAEPKDAEPIAMIPHDNSICASLAYSDGTLCVATRNSLTAVDAAATRRWRAGLGHWPQWRGPHRDNQSQETGLLASWPAAGPPLAFRVDGLGDGIASLAIVDGRILTTTTYGDREFAVALDSTTGKGLWMETIGSAVQENPLMRWLSQRAPTVDGQRAFVYSNNGWLVCLNAAGDVEWRVSYPHEFGTPRGKWGFCDRPLVDGDHVICTPGGTKATVAALDKHTGKVVWSKLLEGHEAAGYAATMVVHTDGLKQYVVTLDKGLVSMAATDGRLLWRYASASDFRANSYTPLVVTDGLLCPNGYGTGVGRIKLSRQGDEVIAEEVYYQRETLDAFEDSTVLIDDRLYAFGSGGVFLCLSAKDGKRLAATRGPSKGKVAATWAEGRLYVRGSDGVLTLLESDKAEYSETGRFTLPEPRNSTGATFPVIAGRRLYVRDNDRLYCYDIAQHPADYVQPEPLLVELEAPAGVASQPRQKAERMPNAIFVPTPDDVVDEMLAAAKVGKDDVVYDLGSGDGRIVIQAAKKFACRGVGVELDRDLFDLSRNRVAEAGLAELVTIKHSDLFETDFSDATVVTVYLYPKLLEQLLPKLQNLKPGTRIISHQFEIPNFPAEIKLTVDSKETGAKHTIFVWTTPLKK